MESITEFFKIEEDPFYIRGEKKGIEKGKIEVVKNLIIKLGLSDEQVASAVEVPVELVKKIRDEIESSR